MAWTSFFLGLLRACEHTRGHGVLAALLSARAPQRIRAHPSLRLSRQSLSRFPLGTVPTTTIPQRPPACPNGDRPSFLRGLVPLALPALWRHHDRDAEIYGCGIIHMLLLRFVVACPPLAVLGCAPAHRRIRVPTPRRQAPAPVSAHTLAGTCGAVNDRDPAFPVRRRLPNSRLGSQLAFKSHSAPRPPQTPAASS
jgi:hypothetical protein